MANAPLRQPIINVRIAEFGNKAAFLADGEGRHLMMMRVLAGHVGIEAFKPVSQPLLDELVEGAIDRRGRDRALGPHLVQHLIGRKGILSGRQNPVNALLRVVQLLKGMLMVGMGHDWSRVFP